MKKMLRCYLLSIIVFFSAGSWFLLIQLIFIAFESGTGYILLNFNTYNEISSEILLFSIIFTFVLIMGVYLIVADLKEYIEEVKKSK